MDSLKQHLESRHEEPQVEAEGPERDDEQATKDRARSLSSSLISRHVNRTVQKRAVQRKAARREENRGVGEVAASGVADASSPLPHLEEIQTSFGRHDLTGVQSRVGGPATAASEALGAEAFTTGSQVGFRSPPDLHTAAHEAAHVVQQRAGVQLKGGVGEVGDRYEANADAVADKVVAGDSAEPLLDGAQGAGAPAVQRKAKEEDQHYYGNTYSGGDNVRQDENDAIIPGGVSRDAWIARIGHERVKAWKAFHGWHTKAQNVCHQNHNQFAAAILRLVDDLAPDPSLPDTKDIDTTKLAAGLIAKAAGLAFPAAKLGIKVASMIVGEVLSAWKSGRVKSKLAKDAAARRAAFRSTLESLLESNKPNRALQGHKLAGNPSWFGELTAIDEAAKHIHGFLSSSDEHRMDDPSELENYYNELRTWNGLPDLPLPMTTADAYSAVYEAWLVANTDRTVYAEKKGMLTVEQDELPGFGSSTVSPETYKRIVASLEEKDPDFRFTPAMVVSTFKAGLRSKGLEPTGDVAYEDLMEGGRVPAVIQTSFQQAIQAAADAAAKQLGEDRKFIGTPVKIKIRTTTEVKSPTIGFGLAARQEDALRTPSWIEFIWPGRGTVLMHMTSDQLRFRPGGRHTHSAERLVRQDEGRMKRESYDREGDEFY